MQSLGCAESRDCSVFFKSMPEDVDCPDQTWTLGFAEAELDLDSLWRHVQQCHRGGKLDVKTALTLLWS